ncbi:hypothetical protein [Chenggangzhangella methanolivorans]|uniref:Uncharacterized protein n=1 Tax=Chenggangzhangella methanolivorans TaxID=1437009 RepID=A0A9E6R8G0_9HYPH|nr:hypothetical protein [Chenggangzhangella methanolivorans]QZN98557.1 hypothetical protein K6K41_16095 [Chenggangzhangella methanolivorans]
MQTISYIPPGAPATALACAILSAQADRMDRLVLIAERELKRADGARARLNHIIHVLIERLDTIEAATVDLEDDDTELEDEGDELDFEEGDGDPDDEPTLGSVNAYNGAVGSGTYWNGVPMSAKADECEATAPERAGAGFVACSGDDEEEGGDTEGAIVDQDGGDSQEWRFRVTRRIRP